MTEGVASDKTERTMFLETMLCAEARFLLPRDYVAQSSDKTERSRNIVSRNCASFSQWEMISLRVLMTMCSAHRQRTGALKV